MAHSDACWCSRRMCGTLLITPNVRTPGTMHLWCTCAVVGADRSLCAGSFRRGAAGPVQPSLLQACQPAQSLPAPHRQPRPQHAARRQQRGCARPAHKPQPHSYRLRLGGSGHAHAGASRLARARQAGWGAPAAHVTGDANSDACVDALPRSDVAVLGGGGRVAGCRWAKGEGWGPGRVQLSLQVLPRNALRTCARSCWVWCVGFRVWGFRFLGCNLCMSLLLPWVSRRFRVHPGLQSGVGWGWWLVGGGWNVVGGARWPCV